MELVFSQNFDAENTTTVKVHFKEATCIKYRRELYLTWDGVFGIVSFNDDRRLRFITRFLLYATQLPLVEFSHSVGVDR